MNNAQKTTTATPGSLIYDEDTKRNILQRMRTVSGHFGGIERMIEDDAYCIDILKQIAAVQASLSKIAIALSESHMRHCVRSAIYDGEGEAKIDELMETLKYLKYF